MKTINAVLMVIAVLLLVAGCAQTQDSSASMPATIEEEGSTLPVGSSVSVMLENNAFSPADVVIKAGDSVEWLNKDNGDHTLTFDNGEVDELLSDGASFSHTFTEAGEYAYNCKIHSGMQGKVIVE